MPCNPRWQRDGRPRAPPLAHNAPAHTCVHAHARARSRPYEEVLRIARHFRDAHMHNLRLRSRATSLKPLFDRVLVQRAEIVAKIGSVYVPETAQSKMSEGLVIATGPGARNQAGETVKMSVQEGDKVLLPEYGGEKVEIDKQEYFLFRETELLGVLS